MQDHSQLVSVRELIDRQALNHANDPFLIQPDSAQCVTFLELQKRTRSLAQHIASHGIKPGSSVAYAMSNGLSCAMTVLGIMYGGYRAVAINLVAGRDVIAYVLAHSQSVLVLTQDEHRELVDSALVCDAYTEERAQYNTSVLSEPGVVTIGDTDKALWEPQTPLAESQVLGNQRSSEDSSSSQVVSSADDALLMYTSGTTGRPKGVTLSHANVIAGGRNVVIAHQLTPKDKALCVLPLYHINGLCVTVFGPLVSASSLVLPHKFSTSAFWALVDEYRCSWFSVVPTQIAYLLRDAHTSNSTDSNPEHKLELNQDEEQALLKRDHLRFGRSASAPLSPDVHLAFENRFGVPLIETMGLTESAAQILSNPLPPAQRKHGSPGLAVGCEVIIADKNLHPVAADIEGELLVKGDNVMNRYFRNIDVTADTLVNDGWLRTGDLGRKDTDGYLFITGRLKELIIKGGENIAPREVDDALYQHPDVVEAAAFARPCDDFGQRVEAAVVLKAASKLSESILIDACLQRVGRFKCPDRIHILQELPKGPSGKIQRAKILQLLSEQ